MITLNEENSRLSFSFEDEIDAKTYDKMAFYREGIANQISGIKAIDFICIDNAINHFYMIEVRDCCRLQDKESEEYKRSQKAEDLALEVSRKVLESIAGLWVASHWNDCNRDEKDFAINALQKRLRVVLHYELPANWTEEERKKRMADIKNKLAKKLRIIDANPLVVNCQLLEESREKNLLKCPWSVSIMEES